MTVNITCQGEAVPDISYPCLKINDEKNLIILFTNSTKGSVIFAGPTASWNTGDHSNSWNDDRFMLYNGEIIIKNKLGES